MRIYTQLKCKIKNEILKNLKDDAGLHQTCMHGYRNY